MDSSQFLEAIIRLTGQQKLTMQNLERENERLRNQTTSDSPVQGPPVLRLSTTEGSQGTLNPTQRTSVPPALATEPGQGIPSVAAQKVSAPAPPAPCDQEEPWVPLGLQERRDVVQHRCLPNRSESDKEISKLFGLDNRSFLRRPRRGRERQGETNEGHRVPAGPSAEPVGSRAGIGNIRSGPLAGTAGGRAGARLANQPTDQVGTQGSMLTQGRADPQAGPRPSTTTSQMSPAAVNARPNPP
jgi:hypothetical protein